MGKICGTCNVQRYPTVVLICQILTGPFKKHLKLKHKNDFLHNKPKIACIPSSCIGNKDILFLSSKNFRLRVIIFMIISIL